jgi:hypothetical protein
MLVVKMATMVVVSVLQTEMAVGHLTSALAEMPSKTVSSLPVVAVVLVRRAQVVTVVQGKLVPMVQQVWLETAKDAAHMLAQVAMAHVQVAETEATQAVDTPAVAVVLVSPREVPVVLVEASVLLDNPAHLAKAETAVSTAVSAHVTQALAAAVATTAVAVLPTDNALPVAVAVALPTQVV